MKDKSLVPLVGFCLFSGVMVLKGNSKNKHGYSEPVSKDTDDQLANVSHFDDHVLGESEKLVKSQSRSHLSRYWDHYPNTSESYGEDIAETSERSFLNESQKILSKSLKTREDLIKLKSIFSVRKNYETIADHYHDLPESFYFVEEATRIKMLNFLIASMEIGDERVDLTLDVARKILSTNVVEIGDPGLAQSVGGDVIRILAAVRKYYGDQYEIIKKDLLEKSVNTKLIDYFEKTQQA